MSSDEEEPTSPFLPKDSDRGSSVSSELQDEYEEILRYAVVTPKVDTRGAHVQRVTTTHQSEETRISQRKDDPKSQHPADTSAEAKDGMNSSRIARSSQTSPLTVEQNTHLKASYLEETAPQPSSRLSLVSELNSTRIQTMTERTKRSSSDRDTSSAMEMVFSEQNMNKMETILDMWSSNLKSNVMSELQKWKLVFMEMRKEKECFAAEAAGLRAEVDKMKGLLCTYETSIHRKDEVIAKLSNMLDKRKAKLEQMKTFTHWRLQNSEAKEEAHSIRMAQQHYNLRLRRKVWSAWQSLVRKHWKVKLEQACRARAEEVCGQMSMQYEAKLEEQRDALEQAQAEIQWLRFHRERYEESMKKAFMRGVCALNMEALNMFHNGEARPEPHDPHDSLPPQDESGSAAMSQPPPNTYPFTRFNAVHFDQVDPPFHSEAEEMMGSGAPSRADALTSTSAVHNSLPLGGAAPAHKQFSGRVVTASQQKSTKTVTARVTGRTDRSKAAGSKLQVTALAPPMSSVVIERHHPVTQLTISQATAAKFTRLSQQGQSSSRGRSSSRTQTNTCQVHSIKVVD